MYYSKKVMLWIIIGLFLLAIVVAYQLFVLHRNSRNQLIQRQDTLIRIGFQFDSWGIAFLGSDSPWRGKWLWTHDRQFLEKVIKWRRNLQYAKYGRAFSQRGGRIVLEFKNGSKEEYLFVGPDRPSIRASCYGLTYGGKEVCGQSEPFSEYLRRPELAGAIPED